MLFSGIFGVSSEFSSILSRTDEVGVNSPLEIIVKAKLQIINRVATTPVAFVIKFPADLENILLVLNIIFAVILVLIVLLQRSEGGALGIGVSQENLMFSKSSGNFMTKATAVVATLFIICSLALTIISRGDLAPTSSVLDKIEEKVDDTPEIPENNN